MLSLLLQVAVRDRRSSRRLRDLSTRRIADLRAEGLPCARPGNRLQSISGSPRQAHVALHYPCRSRTVQRPHKEAHGLAVEPPDRSSAASAALLRFHQAASALPLWGPGAKPCPWSAVDLGSRRLPPLLHR